MRLIFLLLCWLVALGGAAQAQLSRNELDSVGISAKPGDTLPLDDHFVTETGRATNLGAALGGKPALLVFADFTCRTLCGATIAMASDALARSGLDPKSDFRFVVIGMDPKDMPADAAAMKAKYLENGLVGPETAFLLGDEASLARATTAAGYSYVYDKEADQFAHPTGAFVLTPDGRISQVLTAIGLSGETVRLALVEAADARIGSFADHVRLLCYGYDPATGRYSGLILGWLRGLGLATAAGLGLLIFALTRRHRHSEAAGRSVS